MTHDKWKKQRIRRERLGDAGRQILALEADGYQVSEIRPNHYRVNDRLDLFPLALRYFDTQTQKTGVYAEPIEACRQTFGERNPFGGTE